MLYTFNINSKSDTTVKQSKDAIVRVFLKVFKEMQCFCGYNPFIADLERRLTEEGRISFMEDNNSPWEESRHKFDFIQDSIIEVLDTMDSMSCLQDR